MRVLAWVVCLVLAGCAVPGARARTAQGARISQSEVGPNGGASASDAMDGLASYYHDSLAGNTTANGEVYDPHELTAASRTLPFGTRVKVTRRDTGESVVVRINDRGPFADPNRIIDLSRAAAEELDMIRAGVVPIRLEILD